MKPWMIVAIALIATGGLLFCVAMSVLGWDFSKLTTVKYEENRHDIREDFQNITIKTNTADVRILPAAEGVGAYVVSQDQAHLYHSVTVQEGELIIERHDERKWYEMIEVGFNDHVLTVYLPETAYHAISITLNTGDVSLPQGIAFGSVDIKGSTGDVECRSNVLGDLCVRVGTGDIDVKGISVGGKMTLTVSTGDVKVESVTCTSFASEGSTGDLCMNDVVADEKFAITRGTGDVKMERCDAAELVITTGTGDVKGTLLSEKIFIAKAGAGDVKVPETTGGGLCKITTSTGDIQITIVD